MLNALQLKHNHLEPLPSSDDPYWLQQAIWVNLINPSDEERAQVEAAFAHPLPETREIEELEASSNYFVFEQGFQVNCLFLHRVEGRLQNTNVAFLLDNQRLVTLSAREIPLLRLLRMRARRDINPVSDPICILMILLELKVDELADILEETHRTLETISRQVLERNDADLQSAIDGLAESEDINGKVRLCLMDGQRDLNFLLRRASLSSEFSERVYQMLSDIDTLLSHNTFLTEKVNFLLNAALGFINIQQARIIKIFSIAAVVFLPPTLIASSYGMNFQFMPELGWRLGYPIAITLMLASGIAPYLYFKRKGWL